MIKGKIDIGLISETKIDESFPKQQFKINGYKTIRRDGDSFGVGLIFYINEQIPSKVLTLESIPRDIEIILLDLRVKNRKWLRIGLYKPPFQNEKYFLDHLSKTLGQLTCQYDKTILIGDFNLTVENNNLENFMNTFDLECLIKKPTCFQSSNQRCIDLILTNKKELFKNNDVFEVRISDHHSFIVTALKSQLLKGNAKTKLYRDYSSFNLDIFKEDLENSFKNNFITEYSDFENVSLEIFHKHAPIKKKILRFNDNLFMTKSLRKAIMHRSKLKNIYHKTTANGDWDNYKKQRNFCVNLLRNTKKDYFQKLNIKDLERDREKERERDRDRDRRRERC